MKKFIMIVALGASVITAPALTAIPAAAAQHARTTQVEHPARHCVSNSDSSTLSAFPSWEVC
jgi:hypothetical protein